MPRKPKISHEELLVAALSLIDEEGIEALSMRRLGEALGVRAMSLYNYVESREEILQGIYRLVLRSVRLPERSSHWRRDLSSLAAALREAFVAHPQVLPLFVAQPTLNEVSLDLIEWTLSVLECPIPQELDRLYALHSFFAFVIGQSASQLLPPQCAFQQLGSDSAQFYPQIARLQSLFNQRSREIEFDLGLQTLLNGIEQRNPF